MGMIENVADYPTSAAPKDSRAKHNLMHDLSAGAVRFTLAASAVLAAAGCAPPTTCNPRQTHEVTVMPGDTVWKLATESDPDPHVDTRIVVDAIERLNHLGNSADIQPGQGLVVFDTNACR